VAPSIVDTEPLNTTVLFAEDVAGRHRPTIFFTLAIEERRRAARSHGLIMRTHVLRPGLQEKHDTHERVEITSFFTTTQKEMT
jgi:hypothetical protein